MQLQQALPFSAWNCRARCRVVSHVERSERHRKRQDTMRWIWPHDNAASVPRCRNLVLVRDDQSSLGLKDCGMGASHNDKSWGPGNFTALLMYPANAKFSLPLLTVWPAHSEQYSCGLGPTANPIPLQSTFADVS